MVGLFLIAAVAEDEEASILFDSTRDGDWNIYSMNVDGSNQIRLTQSFSNDFCPWPSPDGSYIVFSSQRAGSTQRLYTMRADGQDVQGGDVMGAGPVWSPDGLRYVFVSLIDGDGEICVVNADGTGFLQLTDNACGDFEPTWLPDGDHIGWSSGLSGNADIYVMQANGTNFVQLTDEPSIEAYPNWSPDGSRIVFCSDRSGAWEIYVMDADGDNVCQLTDTDKFNGTPRWSPDGTRIVFQSNRDGDSEIYVMDADGGNVRQLTDNTAEDAHPCWLPQK